jgi:hypothetical protein
MRRILLLIALSASGCNFFKGRGQFAFTVADHSNLPVLEQHFFKPQRFVKPSTLPIFERDDVLWYAYRPAAVKNGKFYGISLQKKTLGYQEIDLRNRTIIDGQGMLIDHYKQLEEGEYRLKIAYENEVIDQIDFIIVGDSASESIDYSVDETEA